MTTLPVREDPCVRESLLSRRIRLVIPCLTTAAGGIDRVVSSLIRCLDRQQFAITLLARDDYRLFPNAEHDSDIQTVRFPVPSGVKWMRDTSVVQYLTRVFDSPYPALCNPHDYLGLYYSVMAARLARVPTVIVPTIHQLPATLSRGPLKRAIFTALDRSVLPRVDHLIGVSEGRKRELLAYGVAAKRISVVRNGIEGPVGQATTEAKAASRHRLGLPAGGVVIGYSGRLSAQKGLDTLLDALSGLGRNPDLVLAIAGSGELGTSLKAQVEELKVTDLVHFLGFVTDMDSFYHAIDILVLPSLNEGLSMSVLEAMRAGLPVIATRVGGNPEIVIDGVTGWLVAPREVRGLRRAIAEAVTDRVERERRGRAGASRASTEFSIERMVIETAGVLASAWANRVGSRE